MPKSPHPGHQSLKTSVLTSSSLSMAHHRRAPGALQLLEDPLPDLVLGEGAAVELVDEAADVDAGHLADQAADLAAVVPLDHHVGLRLAQDLADRVAGEGEEEPQLEEGGADPLPRELLDRVEDRALRRAPADDHHLCVAVAV